MKQKKRIGILLFVLLFSVGLAINSFPHSKAAGTKVSDPQKTQEDTLWDCVYFGSYYEDGETEAKKPIKWRVLSVRIHP